MLHIGNHPAETYSLNMVILRIISLKCGDFGAVFSFLTVALDFVFIAKWQKFSQKENTGLHDPSAVFDPSM
jgi:hypothetical protein